MYCSKATDKEKNFLHETYPTSLRVALVCVHCTCYQQNDVVALG